MSDRETVWVLGGGLLRGLAHIGALPVLEERFGRPDHIVGTSIGALIGAAYAGGRTHEELNDYARTVTAPQIFRRSRRLLLPGTLRLDGVINPRPYREYIEKVLPVHGFDALDIPISMNAVDLRTGGELWFRNESAGLTIPEAVYASSALPLLFPPLRTEHRVLVDGGVLHVLGIEEAFRWNPRRIVIIDVTGDFEGSDPLAKRPGLLGLHERAMDALKLRYRSLTNAHWQTRLAKVPEVIWVRPEVGSISGTAFSRKGEILEAGERAAVSAMPDPRALLFRLTARLRWKRSRP